MESAAEGMLGNGDGVSGVSVTLENEAVWSRFHSLGTEMILTARGRRMFPCCRFRLSGLQPHLSYFLILDITPLDELRHRWNGNTWEPQGAETPLQTPVCFRDGAVTGFKINPDLIPHVCFHPDAPAPGQRWMDGPVSFYKMKLAHSPEDPDAAVVLRPMHRYQPRLYVVPVSTCPEPDALVFTFPKTAFYAVTSYQNPLITRLKIDCNPFMLAFREDGPSARLIQNKLKLALNGRSPKHRSSTHTHTESSEETLVRDESAQPVSSLAPGSAAQEPHRSGVSRGVKRVYRRGWRSGARKARAKWWTNVKHRSAAVSPPTHTVSMQPDLEHVDGLLFVSFTAKEALDVHVGHMRTSEEPSASPAAEKTAHDTGWICEQEKLLLHQLQQLKNRQIIHPVLQQVGLKLNLLDPAAPIDLHYLGVALPVPSPVLTSSSHAASVSFTGKTSDVTRIKGWMEKFDLKSKADSSGSAGHSAFSSVLLDEYLEAEAQRISERADVFSSSAPAPVLYQLPVRSTSYVRTLDSVLQTRSCAPPGRRDKRTKAWRSRRGVRAAPEASLRCSSTRLRWKRSVSEDPPQRPAASSGAQGRRRRRYRRRRRTLRFNRDALDGVAQKLTELQAQEEQEVSLGQSHTHISAERADLTLSSLLTAERAVQTRRVRDGACAKDFCRLGCVCESLNREVRGSTHCRRVQCMFSCGCFRHRILLVRSEHRPRSLVAFPVSGPGSDGRPEPALRVSVLWRRRAGEHDPEPLFTPRASGAPRRTAQHHTPAPRPRPQVQETEKDPVYLYLESMMTCARVREYNSNPPLQVHLLPARRSAPAPDHTVSAVSASQSPEEGCEAGEPEPTKVLEIISGCNWETHRSLVLKELFRIIGTSHLASVFYIHIYKVELLSKDLKKDECGSTLIYKVCVSLGQTREKTRKLRKILKKPDDASHLSSSSSQKVNTLNVNENLHVTQTTNTPDEKQVKHFPLLSRVVPAGLLKADKKTLVHPGPIKVNGKAYAQAKLILGRMGALHPANRLAAYVTGRIKPLSQNMGRWISKTLQVRTLSETRGSHSPPAIGPSQHTVSQANQSKEAFRMPTTRSRVMPWAPNGFRCTPSPAASNPAASSPVAPPLSSAPLTVAPPLSSAETVLPASALPPGQQVVLQPVAGMTGVNMCQFNGQMIQLVPITAAVPVQVQSGAGGTEGAPQEPQSAQMNSSIPASQPIPFIIPRIHTVQGNSTFGSVEALGLQNGFLGKAGMFSFRICPPSAESKTAGVEQTGTAPESTGTGTLLLPGGYRLIKLPMFVSPSVSSPTTASVPAACTEKSAENTHEEPTSIKTEAAEDGSGALSEDTSPVIIKVESYSSESSSKRPCSDQPEPQETSLHIKMEDDTDQSPQSHPKIEEPDPEAITYVSHHPKTSESRDPSVRSSITDVQQHLKNTTTGAGLFFSLFEGRTSLVSPANTKAPTPRPEEIQKKRKPQAPDDPRADSAEVMYSSDGWTTEDSNEWYSEEEVDIETFEEYDQKMNISLLRAKARRKTQQAAQSQWLLKCKSAESHHAVWRMSDLPLYTRTWRLNRALREQKQLVEIQQSLDSLKRMLGVEDDVMMSTQDLLREAQQMIRALEEHNTSLMASKRALIRQHSHYQSLISQRSAADVPKTAAPSLPRSPAHSQSVLKRRLPGVILQSFS